MFDGLGDFFSGLKSDIGTTFSQLPRDWGTLTSDVGAGNWKNLLGDVGNLFTTGTTVPGVSTPSLDSSNVVQGGATSYGLGSSSLPQPTPLGGTSGGGTLFQENIDRAIGGAAPAGGGQPSDQNWLSKAVGGLFNDPVKLAMLGLMGMQAFKGPQTGTAEKTIANALRQQTQIPSQVAQTAMQQYQTGGLNKADQFALDQWYGQQKAKIDDYFSKAGISSSSAHMETLNQLNTQKLAKAEEMRQQYLANALSASGTSGQIGANLSSALAQIQASGDMAAQQALASLLGGAAKLVG